MTATHAPVNERYIGGFFVDDDRPYDAVYHGRRVRYALILDSYAAAVAWRRVAREATDGDVSEGPLMSESFIVPLSQAAGEAADEIRDACIQADARRAAEEEAQLLGISAPPLPLAEALRHLRALLDRSPTYTHYDDFFVPSERCAYCGAGLSDGTDLSEEQEAGHHAPDCAWVAARHFAQSPPLDAAEGVPGLTPRREAGAGAVAGSESA